MYFASTPASIPRFRIKCGMTKTMNKDIFPTPKKNRIFYFPQDIKMITFAYTTNVNGTTMKKEEGQYDIFLSYRRKGGFETAKHIFDLLTRDGYRVSFDIDTLRSGDFDTQLLQRIDECTDFIVILNAGAFDRSIDPTFDRNKDWLRIELAYALEKGKNIIPVMLDGFTEFPDNLPDDIAAVKRKNAPPCNHYYFDAFYNKLLRFLDSNPIVREKTFTTQIDSDDAILKIETDLACVIYIDGEQRGTAQPDKFCRIPLHGGSYRLRFVSIENQNDYIEDRNFRIAKNIEEWYSVSLLPVKQKREAKEYSFQFPDTYFIIHQKNEKYGFISRAREIIIPCIYDEVKPFNEGFALVKKDEKFGFINKNGCEIIPCIYDYADSFSEGLAFIEKGRKWGFIKKNGDIAIPCIYDDVYSFRENRAGVKKDGKYGFIDKDGNEIIPCIYDEIDSFIGKRAKVRKEWKYGFINDMGRIIAPFIYDEIKSFSEDRACVKRDGRYGFIDNHGEEIIPCMYNGHVDSFRDGRAYVRREGKCGFIDKNGYEIIPCIYDTVYSFSEGRAGVKKGEKYGFIDKNGNEIIPCIYDTVYPFSEDLASIKKEGKWGFIDKAGNVVIPCIYDYASSFNEGIAKVLKNGKYGYIDKKGYWITNLYS